MLTPEQLAVVNAARTSAGAGKTFTLVAVARALRGWRILYLTFSRALAEVPPEIRLVFSPELQPVEVLLSPSETLLSPPVGGVARRLFRRKPWGGASFAAQRGTGVALGERGGG
ncbi:MULTISPECIES: hypothetical protein [unclassified Meiothermus]|uniref:hypothetical protein n=1 Tax=unclassified Meiothermus TaxID=370471 RepID=UPI000D7C26C7|nr:MULTISPECIES: hypothetical protein [unclassified Meiothermus]PZA07720.1 hypothetical protein DNA98_05245 [Meiothermus sp. Pnk-1]RYM37489.1 hypothetical protein EWH23_06205 [Meiothermus sp. PNK-Is4]